MSNPLHWQRNLRQYSTAAAIGGRLLSCKAYEAASVDTMRSYLPPVVRGIASTLESVSETGRPSRFAK